jgi:hypothetical protein
MIRSGLFLVAVTLAVGACGTEAQRLDVTAAPARPAVSPAAEALRVELMRTPSVDAAGVETRGRYVQVAGGSQPLERANAELRELIERAQARYAEDARTNGLPSLGGGLFWTDPQVGLISASAVVVSALIPLYEILPGGNADGQGWLALTLPTATGEPVGIEELFADPPAGLAAVARLAEEQLPAENECVKRYADMPIYRAGFAPKVEHYETFALTPSGLTLGFPIEQVASLVCGRVSTTVLYDALRPHLSPLGERLVDGVRAPLS